MRIIHISDLHTHRSNTRNWQLKNLFAVLSSEKFDYLVITGDLTNNGNEDEYFNLLSIIMEHKIREKIIVVPGNHDMEMFGNFYNEKAEGNWKKFSSIIDKVSNVYFISDRDAELTDNIILRKINSVMRTNDVANFAQGRVFVDKYSYWKEDKIYISVLHHHPFDDRYTTKLVNADEFLESNRARLILFGHEHQKGVWLHDNQAEGFTYFDEPDEDRSIERTYSICGERAFALACDNSAETGGGWQINIDGNRLSFFWRRFI